MAVTSATSSISYTGSNSTTTSYAVPFVFQENAHLKAIARTSAGVESVVTLTNHTGAGNVNGGTVRTAVAVPATSTLTIYREVPATQTTTYAEGGDFPAASHERALDKLTYLVQQLGRAVARCVRLTDAAPESSAIPAVANQFFATDSNGAITMVAGVNAAPESITNASISPTAAIAGTKIAPNFGSQNVGTTGFADFTTNSGAGFGVRVRSTSANNFSALQFTNNEATAQWAAITSPAQGVVTIIDGGSAERFRLHSNGNVGIGTSSPSEKLTVSGTVAGGQVIAKVQNISSASGSQARFDMATGSPNAFGILFLQDGAAPYGELSHGSGVTGGMLFTSGTTSAPIVFRQSASERMRIDSSGNVGIGTASPATRLHVDGTIRYTNRPVAGTITAIGFDANGDLRAASSSLRYKHNVEPYAKGLAEVAQLEPVTFNYNGEELVNAGLIVEDLDELGLEEFVLRDSEGTADAIPYGNMVALLINAIKELKVRVEELEAAQ